MSSKPFQKLVDLRSGGESEENNPYFLILLLLPKRLSRNREVLGVVT